MAINKKADFAPADQALATLAKALSHPARIQILRILAERRSCICGEIVEVMPLSQATVSQHLAALKEAGLISGEIDGVRSCYCLNWAILRPALAAWQSYADNLLRQSDDGCCG